MDSFYFTPFEIQYLDQVKNFTDQWIGSHYFSVVELQLILQKSQHLGLNASLLAWQGGTLIGVRLTMAPSKWLEPGLKITPEQWAVASDRVGYFKSLFVAEPFRSQGLGGRLSAKSIEVLRLQGALGIVTHSWLESPNNSSQNYLKRLGFHEIAHHKNFWAPIDYECSRCFPQRCQCTAVEMFLRIGE